MARIGSTKVNEYGSTLRLDSRTVERVEVAWVSRRNGAWLVGLGLNEKTDSATPDELYDCASSFAVAKRTARRMAEGFGFSGAARWDQVHERMWVLTMTLATDHWRYADDDD